MRIELDPTDRELIAGLTDALVGLSTALEGFELPVEAGDIAEEIHRLRMDLI